MAPARDQAKARTRNKARMVWARRGILGGMGSKTALEAVQYSFDQALGVRGRVGLGQNGLQTFFHSRA